MMPIAFLGTGAFGVPALRALRDAGHQIVVAISQPDRPAGRGRRLRPTPIHAACDELGVRHVQTDNVNAPPLGEALSEAQLVVVVAFGQKIGRGVLDVPPRGCVNIHASLLPKYRGAAPFQWAIINGDERTGVTVFQLDEKWDNGPILGQCETPIREDETADELHDRLAVLGAELILETLRAIESGDVRPQPQRAEQATRAPKLTRADGTVDWRQPARSIVRRIHGLWSWPAATCVFASRSGKRERVQLARAQVADAQCEPTPQLPPGAVRDDGTVQAGRGAVRIVEIRPAGGQLMHFEAFANGRHVAAPDRLLPLDSS